MAPSAPRFTCAGLPRFTRALSPGSTCAIGKQKYTLDRATKVMKSEIC